MANLTIYRLDPDVEATLRARAAAHGRSAEEEARLALSEAYAPRERPQNAAEIFLELFGEANGVELELPPRGPGREPPTFE
ncbi:MAG: plasmid stabilization protein [Geminicoccaceae bacterium]|nr:plasmid stabilization protein [Geminicoccaceae bacterium]